MGRRRVHPPLLVRLNGRLVGRLERAADGATRFAYAPEWLDWPHRFAVSLSLPLTPSPYRGTRVTAVFDNLLPDRDAIRARVAERTGAEGTDHYSLLAAIGRDCVGALQFVPEGEAAAPPGPPRGTPLDDAAIEAMLADLARAPLGLDGGQDFRISVAGAQEKTALLRHEGRWLRPDGATPTTHILKPQIGQVPTARGMIDLSASVDNEHYCLTLLGAFGLDVARSEIVTFGARRVLAVERFDRSWRGDVLLRLPQEDMCQALGVPSTRKYQADGGPRLSDLLELLGGADDPTRDRLALLKAQLLFWLIGATDGHAKDVSLFLHPGGRFRLTPFYDVLSAQPAFDEGQIDAKAFRLAMSVGANRHYRVDEIVGRQFLQSSKAADLGRPAVRAMIEALGVRATDTPNQGREQMPADFAESVHASVSAGVHSRLPRQNGTSLAT